MANPIYFALLKACDQPGCPVCHLAQDAVEHMLDGLFYENVNDPKLRSEFRKSLGFCNQHSWQLLEKGGGDALGVAMIYHDIFTNVLRKIPEEQEAPESEGQIFSFLRQFSNKMSRQVESILRALTPRAPCLACTVRNDAAILALKVLSENMSDSSMKNAFQGSTGLCLPHLRQALELAPQSDAYQSLLAINRKKLADLDHELAELIRKSDYRLIQEGFGSEGNAWIRAMKTSAGEKYMGFRISTKSSEKNQVNWKAKDYSNGDNKGEPGS